MACIRLYYFSVLLYVVGKKGLHRNGEKSQVKLLTCSVWSALYVVYSLVWWLQRSVWSADSTEQNRTDWILILRMGTRPVGRNVVWR